MPRFKAVVEYNGSKYHGFQKQDNAITIQSEIETALSKAFGENQKVVASGRTDSGVHALGQVIHFDSNTGIPAAKIPYAVNVFLPKDIAILKCELVDAEFHARYSAKKKTYIYSVTLSKFNRPLNAARSWIYPFDINFALLEQSAKKIIGEHDFVSFMASGSSVKNTVREVYSLNIERQDDSLNFVITANGFLYNMVRIIVGTLLDIARGRLDIDCLDKAFENKSVKNLLGTTAPPQGLCLFRVDYD